MMQLRREPFRLFFPLAALLGLVGVLPWLLFGAGAIRAWLGVYHALTMTQAFLVSVAAGFLGTMIPRRTSSAPLSSLELGAIALGLCAVPVSLLLESTALAQVGYLTVLGTLAQFVIRRLHARKQSATLAPVRPPPPSFVFIPVGLVAGIAGAALVLSFSLGAPAFALALGRALVEEGLLLGLVLALAPMLTPIILHGAATPDAPPAVRARRMRLHALAGLVFLGSFVLQHAVSEPAGLLVRAAVVLGELLIAAGIWRPATTPGLHRRVYQLALILVPVGLLAAGLRPPLRVPFLHLTFVGGLSLLVFAVSMHVTFLHTGNERLAEGRPWPAAVIAILTVAAAALRASAERLGDHYVLALGTAAGLWLTAAALWTVFLLPLLLRRPPTDSHA